MHRIDPIPTIDIIPFPEITESAPVALLYTQPAFNAVKDLLHLAITWKAEVNEAAENHWRQIQNDLQGDIIYAAGGGLAVDAAKYIAAQRDLPLVCLPTALSVDAFLTWASGVREKGCVKYLETKVPDRLIIDFDVLSAAPESIRAAGICDVLSIATGCWDWEFAEEQGENPSSMRYISYAAQTAQAILQGALDCAEAAGRGDREGLKQLLDCLALEVQLCNLIGHSRPEEGSEHYFAYAAENLRGKGLPHGDLVGPGIVHMASLQGQNVVPLRRALEACHIPLDRITPDQTTEILRQLPEYCRAHRLPFGIAHTLLNKKWSYQPKDNLTMNYVHPE